MAKAGRLIYQGLLVAWDGFWMLWLSDVLWLVFSLLIITLPLAFGGLYAGVHGLAYGEPLEWRLFFKGMKQNLRASLRWTAFNLAVSLMLVFYIWFFSQARTSLSSFAGDTLRYIPAILLGLWWIINQFTFPFMLAQQQPAYLQALQNTLVMFLKWPGISLGFTLFNLAVVGLSLLLRFPWIVFGASLPALLACLCVKYVTSQTLQPEAGVEI